MRKPVQYRNCVTSIFSRTVLLLCAGLTGTGQVFAAVDPYDEQSLAMGADLYELYCSDCHGADANDRYSQLYDYEETDISEEYAELVELVRGAETPEPELVPEYDWPEWAENPEPEPEPDVRAEVLGTVTRAINTVNEASMESDASGNWGNEVSLGNAARFDPVPGATNLADPTAYFYGISEDEVFNSIANGTGASMPGWRVELGSDENIWHLVNYIRSLWGEEWWY